MRVSRLSPLHLLPFFCLLLLGAPAGSGAQDVKYTSVTRAEFGGALGRMMKLFGGSKEMTEVTYVKGAKQRTDEEKTSTVLDIEGRSFTWLDHDSKTYTTMTFDQAAARAQAAMKEANDSLQTAKEHEQPQEEEAPKYRYEVHVSSDRPGKTATFAGYDAEQAFFTVQIEAIPIRQPDETEEQARQRGGTLVFLSEMWLSTSFPGWKAKQAQAKMWAEALQTTEMPSKEMSQAYTFDPRIKEGFEKLAEETKDLQGEALRSVTYVVSVPYGATYNRDQVLKDANKSLSSDVATGAKNAAAGAVSGMAGGLFGKKKAAAEPPKPTQATITRLTSEVKDCSTAPLAESVFAVPAGYTERAFQ